jgi:Na+:H+ antiporter, NhaC family
MVCFSIKETFSIVIVTLLGVVLSVLFHFILFFGFLPGFIYLIYISYKKGKSLRYLYEYAQSGFLKTKEVMIILLLVGLLLPSWEMSGTIDQMVFYILSHIDPSFFYVSSFLSTLCISMVLGTSVGSLSAIGIPIIGASMSLGMSVELTAGALVSGAFVGDRTSPFSSANQLLSHTLELNRKLFQQSLWKTASIGIIASSLFYGSFDLIMKEEIEMNIAPLTGKSEWILTLPVISLLILALLKLRIKYCFMISILIALTMTIVKEGYTQNMFIQLWLGTSQTGGGLLKILPLIAFIGLAGAYNGIIEALGVFQAILKKWLGHSSSLFTMTYKTMIATFLITMLACNQTLPIILTGRSFLNDWIERQNSSQLARVMADSSMLFAAMIPWSVLAIMCSTVLGVPLLNYLPFAVLIWSLPIITLIYSLLFTKRPLHENQYTY